MGKDKIKDMGIRPLTTLTNLTPAMVTVGQAVGALGDLPIGVYKGAAAFFDLDKLANQPLVAAEQLHILGNLDGATEDYDLQTITVGAIVAGTVVTETLTVPTGEVWYINGVVGTCVADLTGTIVYNWRCSLFPDAAGNVLGGVYHTNWLATPVGVAPLLGSDEFSAIATVFAIGNKPVLLRLPAGTTISGELMNAAGAAAATTVTGTFQLFGFIGRTLVA